MASELKSNEEKAIMGKSFPVHGTDVEIEYGEGIDPAKWRETPDPDLENGVTDDMLDNDQVPDDQPTPDHVVAMLGFDPKDLDEIILEESLEDSE